MPTNREYLDQLASESPDKLKAWFDADHVDAQRDINGTCPNAMGQSSDDAQLKAHSKTESSLTEQSGSLSDEVDSREKLEADVWAGCEHLTTVEREDVLVNVPWAKLLSWLDRAADLQAENDALLAAHIDDVERLDAMGEGELQKQVDELEGKYEASSRANEVLTLENAQVKAENAKLQEEVDRLKRENLNLAHDLGECMADRDRYRELLGHAIDNAHKTLTLVDSDGNVYDEGLA